MAGLIATFASVVYVVVLALLRAAARGDEQLADVDTPADDTLGLIVATDETWLDDQPWECLSDDEQIRLCERMWAR
jgi:hypothetical protein